MPNKTDLIQISIAATLMLIGGSALAQDTSGSAPTTGLTSEFVYKYLAGEVAGQRGDLGLASELFYDLAKSNHDPRLAERATRAAVYGRQSKQALRAANLWTELDPASTEARQATTQLLLGSGDLDAALPHLQKLLVKEETRASGFLYLNGILGLNPDKPAVLKVMQTLAKPYPNLAEVHFAIAHCAWAAGKASLALDELNTAIKLRPEWELAAQLQGEILHKQSPDDAMAFYKGYLEQHPAANEVRLAYAKLLVNQKQFDEARVQFAPLAESPDGNPEVSVAAGLLSVQVGDYVEADHYFTLALDRGFKQPDQLYLYLGQSAEQQKNDDQALTWYERIGDSEQTFDAKLRIASVLARQEKLEEAQKLLHDFAEQAELSSEQQVIVLQAEANLLTQAKKNQEAYNILEHAIATLPNSPDLIYDFAMAAERLHRLDVMEKQLRTLIIIKPDFAQAYNALGYNLADRNERLTEAVKLIEKAHDLSPDDFYILDSMGWVQYRLGKLDQAADYLRRAYTAQTDPEIAAHLGEVLWQQGKHDEAQETWGAALREFPDNEVLVNTAKKFGQ